MSLIGFVRYWQAVVAAAATIDVDSLAFDRFIKSS